MRGIIVVFAMLLGSGTVQANDNTQSLNITCKNYSWSDVETLVEPYLDDVLYTALVMQGQSADYNVSAAASQAMGEALPESVKRILRALINADC